MPIECCKAFCFPLGNKARGIDALSHETNVTEFILTTDNPNPFQILVIDDGFLVVVVSNVARAVIVHLKGRLINLQILLQQKKSERTSNLEYVRIICCWSEWSDSNARPHAPKACALPTAQHPDVTELLYRNKEDFSRVFL